MDFDLSDEQRLLRDSVERLLADTYGFEQRRRHAAEPGGWSREMWGRFAELGLLGLPFAEEEGGFGGGAVETMIVMERFGRALVLEPFFPAVVLCGALLRHAADPATRAELVAQMADGSLLPAFAQAERTSRNDLADVCTTARPDGDEWVLDGGKSLVLGGEAADVLLVTARVSGAQRERDGIGLFLLRADAPGVTRHGHPLQDATRAAEVTLSGARGRLLDRDAPPGGSLPRIERAVDEAIAALCAEAVGAMSAMHEATVDYLKTRKQFGRAIGDFQALQHRAVDMLVLLEQARSITLYATMLAGEADGTERHRAVCAAKALVGRNSRKLAQEAIQLHGGIGVTLEYMVGHHMKRLTAIDLTLGDADTHLAEVARLGGLVSERLDAA